MHWAWIVVSGDVVGGGLGFSECEVCLSMFFPKAMEKRFPPIIGERATNPQFSEKWATGSGGLRVDASSVVQDAPIPNQSMVIVGNSPNMEPYEKPTNKLAFQSSFTSTIDMATS